MAYAEGIKPKGCDPMLGDNIAALRLSGKMKNDLSFDSQHAPLDASQHKTVRFPEGSADGFIFYMFTSSTAMNSAENISAVRPVACSMRPAMAEDTSTVTWALRGVM